ncbi:MAG TPA: LTA synthase family protein [Lysobacter sp.]|nr:LTA synthase family protein [Lysobacter sp.]
MSVRLPPPSTRAGEDAGGFGAVVTRFLSLAPALLAGGLCLRAWALWAGVNAAEGLSMGTARLAGYALRDDLLLFARALPVLLLLSWPLLSLRQRRLRVFALGAFWSLWLLAQLGLEQYYLIARVPLGADLFGYSWQEVRTTASGGMRSDALTLAGWVLPLTVLWGVFVWLLRRPQWIRSAAAAAAVLVAATALGWLPLRVPPQAFVSEDAYTLALNKTAYFVEDNLRYRRADPRALLPVATAGQGSATTASTALSDPRYPFLHREQTPDALGPHFALAPERPPNLVFIIVEGLGRSFSGPDAALGSFTPFLDELAGRSLYWSNFLANQGRTFAVLPSVFSSLPFGEQGFAALGERMPPHAGLLRVLKNQGYRLQFYCGTDASFDNERAYLQGQGIDRIVDSAEFGPHYRRNPYSSWGYDDSELISRVLADTPRTDGQPLVTVVQTMTMHTSYRFPRQEEYRRRVEHRLDELHVDAARKAAYRQFADIYAAVMFTDAALRRYFEAAARDPDYANTVFIITGDHRLPEIPMGTRIERYHVPLIVFSPMLKQPARIRSVSSHLDIAPSVLALLSHNYGLRRPQQVTWVGDGLDMEPSFRNSHDIPLKQAKTILSDFVSGSWFISRDQLYVLQDGMQIEASADAAGAAQVAQRFSRYRLANDRFARELALSPEGNAPRLVAYAANEMRAPTASVVAAGSLSVREVRVPDDATAGTVEVTALFANDATTRTEAIVPLLVLSADDGRQLSESYGAAFQLAPGATREVRFAVKASNLAAGRYFLAVIPSQPDSGRSMGVGRYRIPLRIRG